MFLRFLLLKDYFFANHPKAFFYNRTSCSTTRGKSVAFFCFCGVTFPETNILDPENLPFQKEISIPTIHVGFRECVCLASLCFNDHLI